MGLTYHYRFKAPAESSANELEIFLHTVDAEAKRLGFGPTMVLNAPFDTPERRKFSRRLTHGLIVENDALRERVELRDGQVWDLDSVEAICRVIPIHGVVLVITDNQRCETIFGFFRYPRSLKDANDRDILLTGAGDQWTFEDFVKTPDARLRTLVRLFAQAGYVEVEEDDYAASSSV